MGLYDKIVSNFSRLLSSRLKSSEQQYALCGYCNEPITQGTVMVAEIDGQQIAFHRQSGFVGEPNPTIDCTRSYMLENGGIHGNLMPFSEFEKSVLNQATNTR